MPVGYTEADLAAVQQAIIDFTLGKRVVSVTINGRTTTYSGTGHLETMRALRAEIAAELVASSGQTAKLRPAVFAGGKGV